MVVVQVRGLLFNQLTFPIPRLQQFMITTENLRFDSAKVVFSGNAISVSFFLREHRDRRAHSLFISVDSWHFDWQVSSVAQVFNALSHIPFAVEHLALEHEVHNQSSEEHNEVDRTVWHKLLRPFSNVKTLRVDNVKTLRNEKILRVDDGLVQDISRCLRIDDEELPLKLLLELQELTYSRSGNASGDAFTSFIDARQNTGRPVTLVRRSPSPSPSESSSEISGE
jgi:hypothetical protein